MYDIGFQNLSRAMMSGKPIKVLVIPTCAQLKKWTGSIYHGGIVDFFRLSEPGRKAWNNMFLAFSVDKVCISNC